jgi:hypothetical protein
MANWGDDLIAGPLGYKYCALYPRAREAIKAWTEITGRPLQLPTNVCTVARDWAKTVSIHDIDETGLAPGITTQLYGYREEGNGKSELDLDPLGTGFFSRPVATSAIVSFGAKKFITVGGAAFVTKDQGLAQEMEARGYWPESLTDHVKLYLGAISMIRDRRRDRVYLWDRHLGDCLQRIKREQIIPWRVMRMAQTPGIRLNIIDALRTNGFDVGTNYRNIAPHTIDLWGSRILNFFVSDDYDEKRITTACDIIKRAIG